jgi:hypothetical protein
MRLGMCFYGADSVCNAKTYHPEFGFTKELATSGVDLQITSFLKTAKKYYENKVFSTSNNDLKLLEATMELINVSFPKFQEFLLEYNDEVTTAMINLLFTLTGVIIALILSLHFTGVIHFR